MKQGCFAFANAARATLLACCRPEASPASEQQMSEECNKQPACRSDVGDALSNP
jgi:hypothetical protein